MKLAKLMTLACAAAAASFAAQAATTHVDVMVAFDTTAVAAAEADGTTLQAFAEGQIAKANEVLANSGLSGDFDFRLAGTFEWTASYESYGSISNMLNELIADEPVSPTVSEIRTAREDAGADITVVMVSPSSSGTQKGQSQGLIPYVNGERKDGLDFPEATAFLKWFSDKTYGVVNYESAKESYTFAHEIGHVMGAGHSEIISNDLPGPQLYSYSAALMAQGSDGNYYATIMGYNETGAPDSPTYTVLPYFSSPDLKNPTTGEALGDATHDNVQTLRNTCVAVSNFRKSKLSDSGTTPSTNSDTPPSTDSGSNSGNGNTNVRPTPTPKPSTPAAAQFTEKKTIIDAVVLDDGEVVGLAQFVVSATRNGVSKVSGKITGLDAKKKTVKSTKCMVYGDDVALVDLDGVAVKGLDGALSVTLGSDGSLTNGKIGSLTIEAAEVGVSGTSAYFWIGEQIESIMGEAVIPVVADDDSEYSTLPYAASPEEVGLGLKWSVAKGSRIKAKRDRDTGITSLTPSGTTNLSGLKLNYQAKMGTFKGSFTAYTLTDAGKLKKYKFNVTGVAVNGEGVGIAVCKKAGLTLPVYVGNKPEPAPAQDVGCDSCTATPEATCESCSVTPGTACESCSATPGTACESCSATPGTACDSCSATPGTACDSCSATPDTAAEAAEATSEG